MGRCCSTETRVLRVPLSQLPAFLAQLKARAKAQAAAAAARRKKEAASQKRYEAQRARNKKRRSRGQSEEEDDYGCDEYDGEYAPAPVYADTLDASFAALWAAAPPGTTLRFMRHGSEPPADDLWGEWQAALPLNTLPGAASGAARALPPGAAAQDGGLAAAGALLQAGYLVLPPDAARVALAALRASGPGPCLRARVAAALDAAILDAELPFITYDAPQRGRAQFARAAAAIKQAKAWLVASARDGASVQAHVEQLQATVAECLRDIQASADAAEAAEAAVRAERREAAAERARLAEAGAGGVSPGGSRGDSEGGSESESYDEYVDSDIPYGGWRDPSEPRPRRRVASAAAEARQEAQWLATERDWQSFSVHRALANVTGELRVAQETAAAWHHAEVYGGEEGTDEPAEAAAGGERSDGRQGLLRLLRDAEQAGQAVLTWHRTEDDF